MLGYTPAQIGSSCSQHINEDSGIKIDLSEMEQQAEDMEQKLEHTREKETTEVGRQKSHNTKARSN